MNEDQRDPHHDNEYDHKHDDHHSHHDHGDYRDDDGHDDQKRAKTEEDYSSLDPGATAALMLSELNWWTTDDDIRGWLREGDCEDSIKDLTFSEHKVNGKSKG